MYSMERRRKLTLSALVVVVGWLSVVVALTLSTYPRFWIDPDDQFRLATAVADARRFDEALPLARAASSAAPDNVGYLVFIGYRELDINQPIDAEGTFRR